MGETEAATQEAGGGRRLSLRCREPEQRSKRKEVARGSQTGRLSPQMPREWGWGAKKEEPWRDLAVESSETLPSGRPASPPRQAAHDAQGALSRGLDLGARADSCPRHLPPPTAQRRQVSGPEPQSVSVAGTELRWSDHWSSLSCPGQGTKLPEQLRVPWSPEMGRGAPRPRPALSQRPGELRPADCCAQEKRAAKISSLLLPWLGLRLLPAAGP